MDTDDVVDMAWVWGRSPIGVSVYEPLIRDGVLVSMRLVYVNEAVSSKAGLRPGQMFDWLVEKVIGVSNWEGLRPLYQQMLKDGKSITYARTYDQPEVAGTFSYVVTAWYAPPWVGVQVREASNDDVAHLDDESIRSALSLLDERTKRTEALAELLTAKKPQPFHG